MAFAVRSLWVFVVGLAVAEAANCADTQATAAATLAAEYRDEVSSNCDADLCSSDCIATTTELLRLLSDCYEEDDANYNMSITDNIAACSTFTNSSTFGGEPTSIDDVFNACSSLQPATVNEVLTSYNAQSKTACESDYCSSDCQEVFSAVVDATPSCVDTTDDVNYYETILGMIDTCGSASGSTNTGDSDSTNDGDSSSSAASLPSAGSFTSASKDIITAWQESRGSRRDGDSWRVSFTVTT